MLTDGDDPLSTARDPAPPEPPEVVPGALPGELPGDLPGDEEQEEDLDVDRHAAPGDEAEVSVGDMAVIPYPALREQLGCGTHVGIVVEDRRHLVKVFFPDMDRTFWLDRARVRTVELGRVPTHPLVERLHRLSALLGADLIEIYDQTGDVAVFHIGFRGTDLEGLHRVRELLGDDLRRLRVEPGSMRRVKLNLAFRLPRA